MAEQHSEDIYAASKELRRKFLVPLWNEVWNRIDGMQPVEKNIKFKALAREWINSDLDYQEKLGAEKAKKASISAFTVISLTVVFLCVSLGYVNALVLWPVTILFIMIYVPSLLSGYARSEDRVEAFHRRGALALRIDEVCGLDLRDCVSSTRHFWPLSHTIVMDADVEFLAETMAYKWAKSVAISLGIDTGEFYGDSDHYDFPRYPLRLTEDLMR
jgi:hypothetical protein